MIKIAKFMVIISIAILSGCSNQLDPVVKTANVPVVMMPSPEPINLPRPEITVMNSDLINKLSDKLKKTPDPNFTIYVMDYATFEKFIESYNQIADYIGKKQNEVDYYKEYLKSLNTNSIKP
jgi:hypothetical protein